MSVIKVDCEVGYYTYDENSGIKTYYGDNTSEGFIFKDRNAFNKKVGICYIPECEFDDCKCICETDVANIGYTYEEIRNVIIEEFGEIPTDEFVEMFFNEFEWASVQTYIFDYEVDDEILSKYFIYTEKELDEWWNNLPLKDKKMVYIINNYVD